jgi:hypothetical protein
VNAVDSMHPATHPFDAMSKAPDHHVLLLENGKVRDSRTSATRPAAGSVLWGDPIGPHYVQNVGETELHILAVEIKA